MSFKITKRPVLHAPSMVEAVKNEKEIARFLNGAPDGSPVTESRKGVIRGKREQISHTMPPELLAKVDEIAQLKGQTRAGLINLAIAEYLGR